MNLGYRKAHVARMNNLKFVSSLYQEPVASFLIIEEHHARTEQGPPRTAVLPEGVLDPGWPDRSMLLCLGVPWGTHHIKA